ncbi:MAG: DUF3656 domain-containing protein, partial [Ruminococcaceae bacterium]|nr:DUF3656 domain-containing protein [Oscillospiraceae bacterium]
PICIRTEADKQQSTTGNKEIQLPPVPIALRFLMKAGEPVSLSLQKGEKTVTVLGDIPFPAQSAPMDATAVSKNLCRFGNTPYAVAKTEIAVDEGLMLPVSKLNALRRAALEAMENTERQSHVSMPPSPMLTGRYAAPTAVFTSTRQITPLAKETFAHRYLPLFLYDEAAAQLADGVVLPPVILDSEWRNVCDELKKAHERGAKHALVGNVGHLAPALEAGLVPHGDFRLNICNSYAAAALLREGFVDLLLSPELTLPQIRDIGGPRSAIVYGRIPLMLLEKCVGREVGSCELCAKGMNQLTDRRGEKFPVLRQPLSHRNILYNSRPTVMSDRPKELSAAGLSNGHFLFSTESAKDVDQVIHAYQNATPMGEKIRRM